jgi:hypothetical protein
MNNNLQETTTIIIPNKWYDDLNISNEELTILILLYRNNIYYHSISLCNMEMLCNYMHINSNSNKRIIRTLIDTIISLHKKKLIMDFYDLRYNIISTDTIVNKNYLFYVGLPPTPTKDFLVIKNKEIDSIFNYLNNSNLGKFSLIRYFVACRRATNNKQNFGYLTQGKLKQLVNDSRTIQRYNKILQDELHLIRYNNNFWTKDKHYCTTFIGLYNDKVNFDYQVQCEVDRLGLVYTDKTDSNLSRSKTQKGNNKQIDF